MIVDESWSAVSLQMIVDESLSAMFSSEWFSLTLAIKCVCVEEWKRMKKVKYSSDW